jgi:hypothetical protein
MKAPQLKHYPACGMCKQPFALRHGKAVNFSTGKISSRWCWSRVCKCKPRKQKVLDIVIDKRPPTVFPPKTMFEQLKRGDWVVDTWFTSQGEGRVEERLKTRLKIRFGTTLLAYDRAHCQFLRKRS